MNQFFNTTVTPRARIVTTKEVSVEQYSHKKTTSNVNKTFQVADKSLANTTIDRTVQKEGTSALTKNPERRYKHQNYEQIKKNYLVKVLINRAINTRLSIKKMEEIPSSLFR